MKTTDTGPRRRFGNDDPDNQHCARCGYKPRANFKHARSKYCRLHSDMLERQLERPVVIVGEDDPATSAAFDRLAQNREAAGQ